MEAAFAKLAAEPEESSFRPRYIFTLSKKKGEMTYTTENGPSKPLMCACLQVSNLLMDVDELSPARYLCDDRYQDSGTWTM